MLSAPAAGSIRRALDGFCQKFFTVEQPENSEKVYKLLRSAHFWTLQILSIIIFYIPLSYVIIYLKHLSIPKPNKSQINLVAPRLWTS